MIRKNYDKKNIQALIFVTIFVISVFFPEDGKGQIWKLRRYEIGAGIGTTQIFGDIGGTMSPENWLGLKDIQITETRPSITTSVRYKINNIFSAKTNLTIGFGKGSDATSGLLRQREYRATLVEFSFNFEYYFFQEIRPYRSHAGYRRLGMLNNYNIFALYGFTGSGITYSYSKHSYLSVWETRDLYKSGSNFIPVIPLGVGVKYIIDDAWFINGELAYRYTLSDFVDGYTQTIDSKYNDVYYILTITLGYRLKTTKRNIPAIFDKEYKKMFY